MLLYGFIWLIVGMLITGLGLDATAQRTPEGQLTIAFDTSIASTYLDPAETTGIATPFVFLYGLHDALIKPLPGNNMAPCLAESWTESEDGLTYEIQLRQGLTFHNGDPFSAEDVQFSFLFRQQEVGRDRSKREALLHQIQRLMQEWVIQAPIFEPATLLGVGPRVEEAAVGLNSLLYFAAPYEEMRLKRP